MQNIFVLEDDQELRDTIRQSLQEAGYRVFAASSIREGKDIIESAGRRRLYLLPVAAAEDRHAGAVSIRQRFGRRPALRVRFRSRRLCNKAFFHESPSEKGIPDPRAGKQRENSL